jgi:Ca2+/H+ antiporter, TMEM165/GDT1 family
MDMKVTFAAFAAIFIAELGDKTQLAALNMAASTQKPWAVFWGGAAALVLLTGLATVLGGALAGRLPEVLLRRVSAVLFIALGLWTWFKA